MHDILLKPSIKKNIAGISYFRLKLTNMHRINSVQSTKNYSHPFSSSFKSQDDFSCSHELMIVCS